MASFLEKIIPTIGQGFKNLGGLLFDTFIKPVVNPSKENLLKAGQNLDFISQGIGKIVEPVKNVVSGIKNIAQNIPGVGNTISEAVGILDKPLAIASDVAQNLGKVGQILNPDRVPVGVGIFN